MGKLLKILMLLKNNPTTLSDRSKYVVYLNKMPSALTLAHFL
jgi:hypothetical protein